MVESNFKQDQLDHSKLDALNRYLAETEAITDSKLEAATVNYK